MNDKVLLIWTITIDRNKLYMPLVLITIQVKKITKLFALVTIYYQ